MVYLSEGPFIFARTRSACIPRLNKPTTLPAPRERAATRANWALSEWDRQYQAGEKPTAFKLKKQFNEIRRELFPWTWEVTKNASDQPFLDLGKAFTAFFEEKGPPPTLQKQEAQQTQLLSRQ